MCCRRAGRHAPGRRSRRCCKTRFNANEILTSLMLIYVAELLLSWLVHGPLDATRGYNFPQSRDVPDGRCCRS